MGIKHLSDLKDGQSAVIVKVLGHGGFRKRIMEMGFVRGKTVEVMQNAPLRDPIKYRIMDYEVSLRRTEASMIEVAAAEDVKSMSESNGTDSLHIEKHESLKVAASTHGKRINVALVGNPNSGKTSLFNEASGSREHVGNYGGVTVDAKHGTMKYKGYEFDIYDLPGTYALSAYTPEERYVREHLTEKMPDVIVNVVAASNLERNLYLTTELIDLNLKTVVALNMYDELEADGARLDYTLLGDLLGLPMIPTVSKTGRGFAELFDTVIDLYEDRKERVRHIHIRHSPVVESAINQLSECMRTDNEVASSYHCRYMAIKMLEGDSEAIRFLKTRPDYEVWSALAEKLRARIEQGLQMDVETAVANEKYGFIAGALKETYTPGMHEKEKTTTLIDSIVTHKFWGFPIFFLFMFIMFECTFVLGAYPMGWIESGVAALGRWLGGVMNDGMLKDLIVDGIVGGVGGVIVFLPNILILYFFISFMEDSGYMARAAFIMDRIMHKIGLHGKSFIPLIMGFGCNVPAIMSTRTIESRSSRVITILINPFMSCGARLPVFMLLAGTFFAHRAGGVTFGLYLLGIVVAAATARLLRRVLFKKDDTPFVMELPPYRLPTVKNSARHMWEKARQYLRKMGGLILVASVVVWFLSYFPRNENAVLQQQNSYIGRVGRFVEPVMEPVGLDWKASVALVTGSVAKEVTVSTLGVLYAGGDDSAADEAALSEKLTEVNPATGKSDFNKANALSFMVFVLLYFPCIATLVAIKNEAGGWKWAAFSFVYNTLVAWLLALITYRVALMFV